MQNLGFNIRLIIFKANKEVSPHSNMLGFYVMDFTCLISWLFGHAFHTSLLTMQFDYHLHGMPNQNLEIKHEVIQFPQVLCC